MDGGAVIDYCPMCGYRTPHERGVPAREKECPKCHIPLVGASSEDEVSVPKKDVDKARGQGRGVGGPTQRDGGAWIDYCPMCGYRTPHEAGVPARQKQCPKCHIPLMGASSEEELPGAPAEDSSDTETGEEVISSDDMTGSDITEKGGSGSGHHGHRGRPGRRGGSLPSIGQRATGKLKPAAGAVYAADRKKMGDEINVDAQQVLDDNDMNVKDVMRLVTPGGMFTRRFFAADAADKNAALWFHLRDYTSLHWDDAGLQSHVTALQEVGASERNVTGVKDTNAYLAKSEQLRQKFVLAAEDYKRNGHTAKEQEALQKALAFQREAMIYTGVRDDLVYHTTQVAKSDYLTAAEKERTQRRYVSSDVRALSEGGAWQKYVTSVDRIEDGRLASMGTYNVRGPALSADAKRQGSSAGALSFYIDVATNIVSHYNSRYISEASYDDIMRRTAVLPEREKGGGPLGGGGLVRREGESEEAFEHRITEWVGANRGSTAYAGSAFQIMNEATVLTEGFATQYLGEAQRRGLSLVEKAAWMSVSMAATAMAARLGKQTRGYYDTVRAVVPSDSEVQAVPDAAEDDGLREVEGGSARPPASSELPVGPPTREPRIPERRRQLELFGESAAEDTGPEAAAAEEAVESEEASEATAEAVADTAAELDDATDALQEAARTAGAAEEESEEAAEATGDVQEEAEAEAEAEEPALPTPPEALAEEEEEEEAAPESEGAAVEELGSEARNLADAYFSGNISGADLQRLRDLIGQIDDQHPGLIDGQGLRAQADRILSEEPAAPAEPPAEVPEAEAPVEEAAEAEAPAEEAPAERPTPQRRTERPSRRLPPRRAPRERPAARRSLRPQYQFADEVIDAATNLLQRSGFSEDDSQKFGNAAREGTLRSQQDVLGWMKSNLSAFRRLEARQQKVLASGVSEQLGIQE